MELYCRTKTEHFKFGIVKRPFDPKLGDKQLITCLFTTNRTKTINTSQQ